MYKQSIKDIKVVIIPLDGCILDLNRFRYNYYNHLCNDKNIELSKDEFYSHLSNMYDMYKGLPLSNHVDSGPLNAKIERELLQYLKYKGIKPKEGFVELLEWFIQKDIKVAVISTHRTKDTVQYLQMAKFYNKVHYIIGSDTISSPLPSSQILENVIHNFHVSTEETLVISSFMALNYAANELHMNVIYCQDLVEPDIKEKETSYKVVANLFEVLNTLLFDRYNEVEIYSPILGMNDHMNKQQLDTVRDKLLDSYQNDPQLINIVDQTYEFYISQLKQPVPKEKPLYIPQQETRFQFSDDRIEVPEPLIEDIQDPIEVPIEEKEVVDVAFQSPNLDDQETLTLLLNQINKQENQEIETPKVTDFDTIKDIVVESNKKDEDEISSPILGFIINILYTAAISLLILFIGLIVYIAFIHQFQGQNRLFGIISEIFNVYYYFIEYIFRLVFDGLNSLMSFIPMYKDYITQNPIFSSDGIKLFNIFFFHFIIIGFVKTIIYFSTRGTHNENNF